MVGGVEPPPQPGLQNHDVCTLRVEYAERQRRGDLEERRGYAPRVADVEHLAQVRLHLHFRDGHAIDLYPLAEGGYVGRYEESDLDPAVPLEGVRRFQGDGPLAVGAGDVDHGNVGAVHGTP